MRTVVKKTKAGIMIKRILTPKEREEAKKRLFKLMDKIYERTAKNKARVKN